MNVTAAPDPARDPARVRAAARDFEGVALGELFQPMFETLGGSGGPFSGGAGEQQWMPILAQQIGRAVAASGGLGLAGPVMQAMLMAQEKAGQEKSSQRKGQATP
jgi:peptidoglycan hydrolase FlgJ